MYRYMYQSSLNKWHLPPFSFKVYLKYISQGPGLQNLVSPVYTGAYTHVMPIAKSRPLEDFKRTKKKPSGSVIVKLKFLVVSSLNFALLHITHIQGAYCTTNKVNCNMQDINKKKLKILSVEVSLEYNTKSMQYMCSKYTMTL